MQVAVELTAHNALESHLRDELGITELDRARPIQAAYVSFFAFCAGGILPFLMSLFAKSTFKDSVGVQLTIIGFISIVALFILGSSGAKLGGATVKRALIRVVGGGIIALAATSLLGSAFA